MMEEVIDKTKGWDETVDLRKIIGVRVLSEKGLAVGKVSQIRIHPETKSLEGVLVRRGFFRESLFIGRTYFDTLSPEAIILNMEPSILFKGKKAITYDGEVIGKVREVVRVGKTNALKQVVVHSFLRGTFTIPVGDIKALGKTIMLKNSYNAPKKSLWRRTP